MSETFCRHPYKYDGSDDSETDKETEVKVFDLGADSSDEDVKKKTKKDKKEKRSKRADVKEEENKNNSESETEVVKEPKKKHKSSKKKKHRKEKKVVKDEPKDDTKEEPKEDTKDDTKEEPKDEPKEDTKDEPKKYPETDVESDGEDNACVKMSMHFVSTLQKTIRDEDVHALRDTLKKTPIAVVLHYLHYLFHLVRGMPEFHKVMLEYNKKYNVVSRYFLKALRSEERTEDVMNSLTRVTNDITNRVNLNEIDGLLRLTPEFITMVTIQSGNLVSHDKIMSEWELSPGFMKVRDLIAAFFGIKRYFSDPSRYSDRRDLIISCICGGSVKTLSRVMRKTKSEYLTDYTVRKTRAICIPNTEMVKYLHEKYELTFY